jgi:eukaryotic-like serine/threonine-protein kinase
MIAKTMLEIDPWLGAVIAGHYRLLQRITEGRRGVLYRAERVESESPVAVKLVHALRHETHAGFVARLKAEAATALPLEDPNTLRTFASGPVDDIRSYFALEWLVGYDLAHLLAQRGPLNARQAAFLTQQVARSLAYAHRQGVIHGDLTPESIFISRPSEGPSVVKVMDYGRRRFASFSDEGQSLIGMPRGWARYLAPEQITDDEPDQRADFYALGCVLYEALTGERPFVDETGIGLLMAQVHAKAKPLEDHPRARDLPDDLCSLVQRCLSKDRRMRFDSAEEIVSVTARLLR